MIFKFKGRLVGADNWFEHVEADAAEIASSKSVTDDNISGHYGG